MTELTLADMFFKEMEHSKRFRSFMLPESEWWVIYLPSGPRDPRGGRRESKGLRRMGAEIARSYERVRQWMLGNLSGEIRQGTSGAIIEIEGKKIDRAQVLRIGNDLRAAIDVWDKEGHNETLWECSKGVICLTTYFHYE